MRGRVPTETFLEGKGVQEGWSFLKRELLKAVPREGHGSDHLECHHNCRYRTNPAWAWEGQVLLATMIFYNRVPHLGK